METHASITPGALGTFTRTNSGIVPVELTAEAREDMGGDKSIMGDVVYRATIPLTRVKGPLRLAEMPSESEPVRFGTHGPIARHYGIQGDVPDPHATTIDYVIAATGG